MVDKWTGHRSPHFVVHFLILYLEKVLPVSAEGLYHRRVCPVPRGERPSGCGPWASAYEVKVEIILERRADIAVGSYLSGIYRE